MLEFKKFKDTIYDEMLMALKSACLDEIRPDIQNYVKKIMIEELNNP